MKLEHEVLQIARKQAEAGLDTEKLTLDGLALCIGMQRALSLYVQFDENYTRQNGTYFDAAQRDFGTGNNFSMRKYMKERNIEWNNFALEHLTPSKKRMEYIETPQALFSGKTPSPLRTGYEGNFPDPHKFP